MADTGNGLVLDWRRGREALERENVGGVSGPEGVRGEAQVPGPPPEVARWTWPPALLQSWAVLLDVSLLPEAVSLLGGHLGGMGHRREVALNRDTQSALCSSLYMRPRGWVWQGPSLLSG